MLLEKALFWRLFHVLAVQFKFFQSHPSSGDIGYLGISTTVMENIKTSKKALKSLLSDSMNVAIGNLELPKPTKKVKKLLDRSSKKLASEFVRIMKKEQSKSKKAAKDLAYVEDVLKGKKITKKSRKLQPVEAV